MSKQTQWMQVLSALRQLGGIATLTQLNSLLLSPQEALERIALERTGKPKRQRRRYGVSYGKSSISSIS